MTRMIGGDRWWSRDLDFPNFLRNYPPIAIASFLLSVVLATFVSSWLVFTGMAVQTAAFACLWGPRGLLRPTRDTRRAALLGVCAFVGVWVLVVLEVVVHPGV